MDEPGGLHLSTEVAARYGQGQLAALLAAQASHRQHHFMNGGVPCGISARSRIGRAHLMLWITEFDNEYRRGCGLHFNVNVKRHTPFPHSLPRPVPHRKSKRRLFAYTPNRPRKQMGVQL